MAVIHRDTICVITEAHVDTNAFKRGEIVCYYREDDRWKMKDDNDKTYVAAASFIRNKDCSKVIHQYSMTDIIYYLFSRNEDYYTVMWGLLEDAVHTTFKEKKVICLEDIYDYISSHLI